MTKLTFQTWGLKYFKSQNLKTGIIIVVFIPQIHVQTVRPDPICFASFNFDCISCKAIEFLPLLLTLQT